MRICLTNLNAIGALSRDYPSARVGGEEAQAAQLAQAFTRAGHQVFLITGDHGQPDEMMLDGIRVIKAKGVNLGFWRALKRADADVYYYSCAGRLLGVLAAFCGLHKRRMVFRVASDADCDPKRVEIRRTWDRWLYHYGLVRANAVLVQTVHQQQALLEHHGLGSTVAGMLVAPPSGEPVEKDIDVLWVSNLKQIKRPDRLLKLARAMTGVRFHMAGAMVPGEEALYRRIEAAASELPNVTFHGGVPYRDIGRLFDRARVFANTSELEGFPNTFLQSWIRGIPVVTMFDPDAIVESKELGSACTKLGAMHFALLVMLGSAAQRQQVGRNALRFMAQRYSETAVLAPYLTVLRGPTTRPDGDGGDWLEGRNECEWALRAAAADRATYPLPASR